MLSDILSQPYPCEVSSSKNIGTITAISVFVFAFLFLFGPFGLGKLGFERRLVVCLGYGLMCAAAMTFNGYLIPPLFPNLFDESDWTVGRQILWVSGILLTISLFNSIYSALIGISPFSLYQIAIFAGYVILVGIFPVTGLVLIDYLRLFQKHAKRAKKLQDSIATTSSVQDDQSLTLISENKNERLQLMPDELLYLSSEDNYVEVVYKVESNLKKDLLRGTLKNFEQQLKDANIARCHRSYIVNLSQVINISGNAQGYKLTLRGTEFSVPVSRSYADQILASLA